MIQVTTNGRYALRLMLDLAQNQGEDAISRTVIAARQEISADYIAQLSRKLIKAGLIIGVKGPHGGYRLARRSEEITVGDIIRAVEGPLQLVHCTGSADPNPCSRSENCIANRFWIQASLEMDRFFSRFKLSDLSKESLVHDNFNVHTPSQSLD